MASNAGGASISTEQLKARYVGTGTSTQICLFPFDLTWMDGGFDVVLRNERNKTMEEILYLQTELQVILNIPTKGGVCLLAP